ncbi:MAG: hypothetical protein KAR40_10835 [Candidatus Sabulitectum sp.]|nr:hypothetical protein [Candidatus Sabulitectum sp.]
MKLSHFEDSITYAQEALCLLDETVSGFQYAKVMYIIGRGKSTQGKYKEALD